MKSVLLLTLSALLCSNAHSKNYYFALSGDDSRTTTQASSPATPWRSINKLNQIFPNLLPGDSVLFKRGDVFYGTIKVTKSGTSSAPIVISAYGSGEKPVITGMVTVEDWKSVGGGKYVGSSAALGTRINMLTVNGTPKALGRYPNADAANKGYLTIDAVSSSSITDKELSSAPNWTGAELVMRTTHWTLDKVSITAHSGDKLTFGAGARYAPRVNYGYFIQNDVRTLDQFGEWAYNAATKKVTMYFGSKDPDGYKVKASVLQDLIYLYDEDYLVFDNLTLEGANENAVDLYATTKSRIQNCDIRSSGINGVYIKNTNGVVIENNQISNTNSIGIFLQGATNNTVVRGNALRNSGVWAGMGQNSDNTDLGIRANGNYNLLEYNTIDSSGYCGIRFTGNYTIIRNNVISKFGFVKDDAGGIYTSATSGTVNVGRKIQNNIILDGIGAREGTNAAVVQQVSGIYCDNRTSGVEISGNTIARCGKVGLYIHNAYDLKISNNTCFDNTAQVLVNHDDSKMPQIRNLDMRDNIFVSKLADQPVGQFYTKTTDITQFGTVDYNYYSRPLAETQTIQVRTYLYTGSETRKSVTLDQWKPMFGHDDYSKKSIKTFKSTINPDDSIRFVYNASTSSKKVSLSGVYMDARKKEYDGSITLAPYTSAVLIKVGESAAVAEQAAPVSKPIAATNAAPVVKLTSPVANATYNGPASIRMTATASDADGFIVRVEFFVNGVLRKTQKTAPYDCTLTNVPAGTYRIRAKAWDNNGNNTRTADIYVTVKASNTNSITANENIAMMLPENNMAKEPAVSLYPNPAVSNVFVRFAGVAQNQKATLRINDMSGKLVMQMPVTINSSSISIDVSKLNPGMYLLHLAGESLITSQKFVKQ